MFNQTPPEPSPQNLIDQYVQVLDEEDIGYALSEHGTALMIEGETAAGRCEGFIILEEIEATDPDEDELQGGLTLDFCEVSYILPLPDTMEPLPSGLFELIARLNDSHRIGAYEIDIEERELRFRIYQAHPTHERVPREQLLMPLYEGIRAINMHWNCFHMVLDEGHDPAHAVAEYYAHLAVGDEDLDEELLERANDMFELAGRRYASQRDDDRSAILKLRLRQLTEDVSHVMVRAF